MENSKVSEADKEELLKYKNITQDNVSEIYNNAAEKYEYCVELMGYPDPEKVVEAIHEKCKIPTDAPILDFGCGTGLVGKLLSNLGYTNIVGIDGAEDMLKLAEGKGYKELNKVFLCNGTFPEEYVGKFDVAVSAGLLVHHLPSEILDEKISCLRPKESEEDKRYIIFATREVCMEDYGYNKKLKELEDEGKIKFVESFSWTRYENLEKEGIGIFRPLPATCYVYSV